MEVWRLIGNVSFSLRVKWSIFTLNLSKVGLDTSLNSWLRGTAFIVKEKKKKRKEKEEKRERRKRRADF